MRKHKVSSLRVNVMGGNNFSQSRTKDTNWQANMIEPTFTTPQVSFIHMYIFFFHQYEIQFHR